MQTAGSSLCRTAWMQLESAAPRLVLCLSDHKRITQVTRGFADKRVAVLTLQIDVLWLPTVGAHCLAPL